MQHYKQNVIQELRLKLYFIFNNINIIEIQSIRKNFMLSLY